MNGFFSFDGKFYKFGSMLADMIFIGFLWTLFSIPIITMGATTTALYYVCTKKHSGEDVYIFENFLKSFKENFVKATIVFLFLVVVAIVIWVNLHVLGQIDLGILNLPVVIALYFMLFQVVLVTTNAFCIIARFEVSVKTALRYGLFMGYRNFFTTISNWITLLVIFIISGFFPPLFFLMGGVYIYCSSFAFIRLFRQHSAEFDGQIKEPIEEDS